MPLPIFYYRACFCELKICQIDYQRTLCMMATFLVVYVWCCGHAHSAQIRNLQITCLHWIAHAQALITHDVIHHVMAVTFVYIKLYPGLDNILHKHAIAFWMHGTNICHEQHLVTCQLKHISSYQWHKICLFCRTLDWQFICFYNFNLIVFNVVCNKSAD